MNSTSTHSATKSPALEGGLIYMLVVLIGMPSWIFTKFQAQLVPVATSVAYRFSLAALLLALFCLFTKKTLRFNFGDHMRFFCIGVTMFSFNYLFLYAGTKYIASGVVAIIYSTLVVMNVALGFLLFKVHTSLPTTVGALVGVGGVSLIFLQGMSSHGLGSEITMGLALAFAGTVLTSVGNVVAQQTYGRGLPVVQTTAWSMAYGGVMLLLFALFNHQLVFDTSMKYVGSLAFLVIFNSAIGLVLYIAMIGKLGAGKAAYVNIICPVLALGISAVFENSQLSSSYFIGAGLIVMGNMLSVLGKQWGSRAVREETGY